MDLVVSQVFMGSSAKSKVVGLEDAGCFLVSFNEMLHKNT